MVAWGVSPRKTSKKHTRTRTCAGGIIRGVKKCGYCLVFADRCDNMGDILMATTYNNIIVHIIFHTKAIGCLMKEEHLPEIFRCIGAVVSTLSGVPYMVGGRPDHIHLLASIPVALSVADLTRNVKSNTSRWIKTLDRCYEKFCWQRGYGVFSVSESNKENVISYIKNQKEHHRLHSTHEEFLLFLKKNGLE